MAMCSIMGLKKNICLSQKIQLESISMKMIAKLICDLVVLEDICTNCLSQLNPNGNLSYERKDVFNIHTYM